MYIVSTFDYSECHYEDDRPTPLPLFLTENRKQAYRFMLSGWTRYSCLYLHVMEIDEEFEYKGIFLPTLGGIEEYVVSRWDEKEEIIAKAKEMGLPEIIEKMEQEEDDSHEHIALLNKERIEAFRLDKCPSLSAGEVKKLFKKHIRKPYHKGERADWTSMEKDAQLLQKQKEN